MPDLLSTATTLHSLAAMDRRLPSEVHERCLDFLIRSGRPRGFHGHWPTTISTRNTPSTRCSRWGI